MAGLAVATAEDIVALACLTTEGLILKRMGLRAASSVGLRLAECDAAGCAAKPRGKKRLNSGK